MSSPAPWRPLLEGPAANTARKIVADVAATSLRAGDDDPSLARGAAGRALFFHYLELAEGGFVAAARDALDTALEGVSGKVLGPGLFAGLTGVGFVVEQLGHGDLLDEMDAVLETGLADGWRGEFDLVDGLVGIGVYALERRRRRRGRALLDAVVARLRETAVDVGDGIAWRGVGKDDVNLGVAHGVPSVAVVLAAAGEDKLLSGLGRFVRPYLGDLPYSVGNGASQRARAAWCYGEPGVAAALVAAGAREAGLAIGRRAALRPMDECGVVGAGLCHGAAGLGHIYNRLWQASGEWVFAEAARTWFLRAMKRDGVDDGSWLEGRIGLGLALLAATTPVEPAWDRALAVSSCRAES